VQPKTVFLIGPCQLLKQVGFFLKPATQLASDLDLLLALKKITAGKTDLVPNRD